MPSGALVDANATGAFWNELVLLTPVLEVAEVTPPIPNSTGANCPCHQGKPLCQPIEGAFRKSSEERDVAGRRASSFFRSLEVTLVNYDLYPQLSILS